MDRHPESCQAAIFILNNYRWTLYTKPGFYKAPIVHALVKWKIE